MTHSVATRSALFLSGLEEGWVELPSPGVSASALAPLYWLKGSTSAARVTDAPERYRVGIVPVDVLQALPRGEVDGAAASMDQLGLPRTREAWLDVELAEGVVSAVEIDVPRRRTRGGGSVPSTYLRLDLEGHGRSLDIAPPAATCTVEEFVRARVGDPASSAFRHLYRGDGPDR